ncbi:UNVERIFIED_ORG: hypothetical protein E4P37_06640 [Bacillus sp. AZ43]
MITTKLTMAPADLLGLGLDVRPAYGPGLCSGTEFTAVHTAAPTAPLQGTGLPTGGTAVRLRPATRRPLGAVVVTKTFIENNGTTLGIHSSRRPQS